MTWPSIVVWGPVETDSVNLKTYWDYELKVARDKGGEGVRKEREETCS